jgi:hypothetical protein
MSASCVVTSTSFVFLMGTICTEVVGFVTSHMITNRFDYSMHEGLYQRCGQPFDDIFGMNTNIGGLFGMVPRCSWWNARMFDRDPSESNNL